MSRAKQPSTGNQAGSKELHSISRTPSQARYSPPEHASPFKDSGPPREELRQGFRRLRKLEWITLCYQAGATVLLSAVMGSSQAMKTEWLENMLAIIPATCVLLTLNTENKSPDAKRPFGYHRAGTLAFLAAAFALAAVGTFLFYDSLSNLVHHEYPSIGGVNVLGHTIWHGWLMMGAMFITGIPPVILGHLKIPVAKLLHDKALYADADMNRANWLSNGAGLIGLGLVAWGFWWGDSVAALIISLDIMRDGWTNVFKSLEDVMDRTPMDLESERQQPLVAQIHRELRALPFVTDERVLIREHGRYAFAEIFIQPNEQVPTMTQATRQVRNAILPLDWRLQHIVIEFTDELDKDSNVLTREELEIEDG
jgi:cation diffusion facilitator family transporter